MRSCDGRPPPYRIKALQLPVQRRRHLQSQLVRRWKGQAARPNGGLDVGDKVLHHLAGIPFLQANADRVAVPLVVWAAERKQPELQPSIEQRLLHLVVFPRLAKLDDDPLSEALVAPLLLDDLSNHLAVGRVGADIVCLELPEPAP